MALYQMPFFFLYQHRVNALQIQKKLVLNIYLVIITAIFQTVEGEIEDEKVKLLSYPILTKWKKLEKELCQS